MPLLADKKINILVAYPYMSKGVIKILDENQHQINFLLDSGAFTAFKIGLKIELQEYCQFLKQLPFMPSRYFMLDVIGDADRTHANYQTMLDNGFKPIPIFTRGDKIETINEYYKTSDLVGFGGIKSGDKYGFINAIMKEVGTRKCHWLGFIELPFLKYHRPFMCDSSSWLSAARYGTIALYLGGSKIKLLNKKDFVKRPPNHIYDRITELGFDVAKLSSVSGWNGGVSNAHMISTCSWLLYIKDIKEKLGTNLYLAAATSTALQTILNSKKHLESKGLL